MIDPDALGELMHGARQRFAARVHDVGGTEFARPVELGGHDVGGDDLGRPAQAGALHGVHAVAAAADDQDAVAGLDPGAITRGADARRHAAGDQAGKVERHVLVDHDDGGLVHHRALSKGADHAKGAGIGTVLVAAAVAAVELRPLRDARPFGAEVVQALFAPAAGPAARNEGQDDMVAGRDAFDLGSDRFNHARRLVAEHHRRHGDAPLAAHDMIVRAAQADGRNADHDFRGAGGIERDALERQRFSDFAKDGGETVHGLS